MYLLIYLFVCPHLHFLRNIKPHLHKATANKMAVYRWDKDTSFLTAREHIDTVKDFLEGLEVTIESATYYRTPSVFEYVVSQFSDQKPVTITLSCRSDVPL